MEQLDLKREQQRNYHREWYKRNREAERAKQRASYVAKRDERTTKQRAYYRANRDARNEYGRDWAARNPDKVRAYAIACAHRRRGVRLDDDGRAYREVLLRDPCSYCGGPAGEIDHIEPVFRGGAGGWENLTAACRPCNGQKSSKPLLQFMRDLAPIT